MYPKLDMYNYDITPIFIVLLFDDRNDPAISDILSEMSQSDDYVSLEGQIFKIDSIDLMNVYLRKTGLYLYTQGENVNVRQECNAV